MADDSVGNIDKVNFSKKIVKINDFTQDSVSSDTFSEGIEFLAKRQEECFNKFTSKLAGQFESFFAIMDQNPNNSNYDHEEQGNAHSISSRALAEGEEHMAVNSQTPLPETLVNEGGEKKASSKKRKKSSVAKGIETKKVKISSSSLSNPGVLTQKDSDASCDTNIDNINDDSVSLGDPEEMANNLRELCNSSEEEVESDHDEFLEELTSKFSFKEKPGKPIHNGLGVIIEEIWTNQEPKDTFVKKLQMYPAPENCSFLKNKKCNPEVWNLANSKLRQKDLRDQQKQNCITKSAVGVLNIANELLAIKKNKSFSLEAVRKTIPSLIESATNVVSLLSHANLQIENERRYSLLSSLDREYLQLAKNVPVSSELLFGDELAKSMRDIKTNAQLAKKPYSHYAKNAHRFPQTPGNRRSKGQPMKKGKNNSLWTTVKPRRF